jgi:enolase
MISPKVEMPTKSVQQASEFFHALGKYIKEKGFPRLVGDEGGYSPPFKSNEEVFEVLSSINKQTGNTVELAIDAAASEFFDGSHYVFKKSHVKMTAPELTEYYLALEKKYHIFSFEDAFFEDDFDSFSTLLAKSQNVLVVGDDLYTTNIHRIKTGIEKKSTNAVLIKPNQIGTVYETVEAIKLAQKAGMKVIISHRSGETDETFISDLSVACHADFLKAGSMSRYERIAKYNRLLEIEAFELQDFSSLTNA